MLLPSLEVTAFYTALLIIMQIVFTMAVIRIRFAKRISLGDNGNEMLQKRIRSHANFVEVVPPTLIALGLIEYMTANTTTIHILGVVFIAARLLHYIGINKKDALIFRQIGMVSSVLIMLAAAIILLMNSWIF